VSEGRFFVGACLQAIGLGYFVGACLQAIGLGYFVGACLQAIGLPDHRLQASSYKDSYKAPARMAMMPNLTVIFQGNKTG
jgi:hypothetical protein